MHQLDLKVGDLILSRPKSNSVLAKPDVSGSELVMLVASISTAGTVAIGINCEYKALDLQLVCDQQDIWFPNNSPVFYGGGTNVNRLFVVHSNDWSGAYTVPLNQQLSLTTDTSVLEALAENSGPSKYRACAGFSTWLGKSLHQQLDQNWLSTTGTAKLVFGSGTGDSQWRAGVTQFARHSAKNWCQSFSGFS